MGQAICCAEFGICRYLYCVMLLVFTTVEVSIGEAAFNLHSQSKLVWVLKYELLLIGLILYEGWDGIRSFKYWLNKKHLLYQ